MGVAYLVLGSPELSREGRGRSLSWTRRLYNETTFLWGGRPSIFMSGLIRFHWTNTGVVLCAGAMRGRCVSDTQRPLADDNRTAWPGGRSRRVHRASRLAPGARIACPGGCAPRAITFTELWFETEILIWKMNDIECNWKLTLSTYLFIKFYYFNYDQKRAKLLIPRWRMLESA